MTGIVAHSPSPSTALRASGACTAEYLLFRLNFLLLSPLKRTLTSSLLSSTETFETLKFHIERFLNRYSGGPVRFNNITAASKLPDKADVYIFADGIKPKFEDPVRDQNESESVRAYAHISVEQ